MEKGRPSSQRTDQWGKGLRKARHWEGEGHIHHSPGDRSARYQKKRKEIRERGSFTVTGKGHTETRSPGHKRVKGKKKKGSP